MAKARHLIEGTDDPDDPNAFDVSGHLESPVARLALTNGFVRNDRIDSEERYVKKLSNGSEAWLRTQPHWDFERPMDLRDPRFQGGRNWEFVIVTPVSKCDYCTQNRPTKKGVCPHCRKSSKIVRKQEFKELAACNEVTMNYLLGALLQRLATWNPQVPKPTLEAVDPDDPATFMQNFGDGLFYVGGHTEAGIVYWHAGFPNWFWNKRKPQREESAKDYLVALSIINNMEGQTVDWPRQQGPPVHDLFMVPVDRPPWALEALAVPDPDDPVQVPPPKVPDPFDPDAPETTLVAHLTSNYVPDYAKLLRIQREHPDVYISGQVKRTDHHYVHQNTTTFTLEMRDMPPEVDTEETGNLANAVEALIQEECVHINHKIYKALEGEWDHMNSDEAVDDMMEANLYTFKRSGEEGGRIPFAKLSAAAKTVARDWYREDGFDYEWWDFVYEEWKEELNQMGFFNVDIAFGGFSSQGDGASFTADSFDFTKWANWHMSGKPTEKGHPYTDDLKESDDEPTPHYLADLKLHYYDVHVGPDNTSGSDGYSVYVAINVPPPPDTRQTDEVPDPARQAAIDYALRTKALTPEDVPHIDSVSYTDKDEFDLFNHDIGDPVQEARRMSQAKAARLAAELEVSDPVDVADFVNRDVARRSVPIKKLEIRGRRWWRRGAGGMYCTAYIYINDELVHTTPMQGGSGDHYVTLAVDWLRREGYLEGLLGERDPIWYLRDRRGIDLQYGAVDVPRERDL